MAEKVSSHAADAAEMHTDTPELNRHLRSGHKRELIHGTMRANRGILGHSFGLIRCVRIGKHEEAAVCMRARVRACASECVCACAQACGCVRVSVSESVRECASERVSAFVREGVYVCA